MNEIQRAWVTFLAGLALGSALIGAVLSFVPGIEALVARQFTGITTSLFAFITFCVAVVR
jgi:hypothetical protein